MAPVQDFMKRTSMIIIDIIEKNHLSYGMLAAIIGCGKNTISNYIKLITTPSTDFILKLADYYGVNVEWLHTGAGAPYFEDGMGPREPFDERSDAPSEYPLSGSAKTAFSDAETVATPPGVYGPAMEFRISSVLEKAVRLLESKSTYGELLFQNIEALDEALMVERESIDTQFEMGMAQGQVNLLEKQLRKSGAKGRPSKAPKMKRAARKTGKGKTAGGSASEKTVKSKGVKNGKRTKAKGSKG